MTTNFYAPPSARRGDRVVLPEDEARHARAVLRVEAGDELTVVDGEGSWYRVAVQHAADGQVVGSIVETRHDVGEPGVDVTVGLGLLSKRSRFETFVEKAVELGVRRIVPLQTAHTEPESVRADRIRNVMVAALKQCRRSWLPALSAPQTLSEVLAEAEAECRVLCHGSANSSLHATLRGSASDSILVLVGPEGGFHEEEVAAAAEAGCRTVSLGARRLRAETAGIVAVSAAVHGHEPASSVPSV